MSTNATGQQGSVPAMTTQIIDMEATLPHSQFTQIERSAQESVTDQQSSPAIPQEPSPKNMSESVNVSIDQHESQGVIVETQMLNSTAQKPNNDGFTPHSFKPSDGTSERSTPLRATSSQSTPDEDIERHDLRSIVDAAKITGGKAKRSPPKSRGQADEDQCDCPLTFVVGLGKDRTELPTNKTLACQYSPWVKNLCKKGQDYRAGLAAMKHMVITLKYAIIEAGDHPAYPIPKTNEKKPLLIYAKAIIKICREYPWAKSCEYLSWAIASSLGISKQTFEEKKSNNMHLLRIIRPAFGDIDADSLRKVVKKVYEEVNSIISDTGGSDSPRARTRAAAENKTYLSDENPATVALFIEQLESDNLSLLSTANLLSLYPLTAALQMEALQNNILDNLRCVSRYGKDLASDEALHSLCDHCSDNSPLSKLAMDMLIYSQGSDSQVLGTVKAAKNFDLACHVIEKMMERAPVAAEDHKPYLDAEESCRRYHVHKLTKPCV